jgi:hypothetical protein
MVGVSFAAALPRSFWLSEFETMRFPRPRFTIAVLLKITALVAVTLAIMTYPSRQRAKTIAIYNAQKVVLDEAIRDFVESLTNDGFDVVNDSTGSSGSGEWRHCAAVTATDTDGRPNVCYVEVMGFVTHDKHDRPTWMGILPMRISHRDRKLNEQFIDTLVEKLNRHGWKYTVDSKCRGGGCFSTSKADQYFARE